MRSNEMQKDTLDLVIKCTKLTKPIVNMVLKQLSKDLDKLKSTEKDIKQQMKKKEVSMFKLKKGGSTLTNMKVDSGNLKSFDKFAKKYGVEYAVKKDKSTDPPTYHLFFKANDYSAIDSAVKDYLKDNEKKLNRVPIKERLSNFKAEVKEIKQQHRERKMKKGDKGR